MAMMPGAILPKDPTDIGCTLADRPGQACIVAREYGIPAVMATGVATRHIQDGQRITVDGDAGLILTEVPR